MAWCYVGYEAYHVVASWNLQNCWSHDGCGHRGPPVHSSLSEGADMTWSQKSQVDLKLPWYDMMMSVCLKHHSIKVLCLQIWEIPLFYRAHGANWHSGWLQAPTCLFLGFAATLPTPGREHCWTAHTVGHYYIEVGIDQVSPSSCHGDHPIVPSSNFSHAEGSCPGLAQIVLTSCLASRKVSLDVL